VTTRSRFVLLDLGVGCFLKVFLQSYFNPTGMTLTAFVFLFRNAKQNDEFTLDLEKDKTKWTGSFWTK